MLKTGVLGVPTRELKKWLKKSNLGDWGKLKQRLLIFDVTVRIIIAKSPLMYRLVTALFEIFVKIGKDFLTN